MEERVTYGPLEPGRGRSNSGSSNSSSSHVDDDWEQDIPAWEAHLFQMEANNRLALEKRSIWASAIAMPQIARCLNYCPVSVVLSMRTMFNLVVVIAVQILLLTYIGESTQVMAPLGGQMHLCDFGASLDNCPDAEHCVGPGGTKYTSTRLYGYTQWAIQKFVKQSFLSMDPAREGEINDKIDPGEYGLESYSCRFMCLGLFVASVVPEISATYNLARLLFYLDSRAETWVRVRSVGESGGADNQVEDNYKVAGMPMAWKLFNVCFVLSSKIAILHFVLREGTILLMDTATIMDMILGSMSLTWVLTIDGLFFQLFASAPTQHILANMEGFEATTRTKSKAATWLQAIGTFFPVKFVMVVAIMGFYISFYYISKCRWDGSQWISKDMYLPKTSDYHMFDFVFDTAWHTVEREDTPFWTFLNSTDGQ